MALATCESCGRRFDQSRGNCPYCGGQARPESTNGEGAGASSAWKKGAAVVVAALVAVNVWRGVTRESGPDPEIEALHSEEEAVSLCEEEVVSRLAAQNASILAPGRPEYLQGGEYEVRLEVEVQEGRRRIAQGVLCQVQFTPETGWVVEDVTVD